MYQERVNNLEKLVRILELINQIQSYNLRNSKHVKEIDKTCDNSFSMVLHYKKRIAINKLTIVRLKKYYNNTLNNLTTFKI